mgnify:CR=1 FL=1
MKKLLLLLLCVPLIGFGQIEEAPNIEVDKDGYVKKYYENGQLEVEGNRKDGKREGLWKWYYEDGQLAREERWRTSRKRTPISKKCWDEEGNKIDCE